MSAAQNIGRLHARAHQPQKILLFGGAFDPPHFGHVHLLQQALQTVQPDLALIMPTGTSPHKASSLTPGWLRRRMCRCFLTVDARVRLCSYELFKHGKNYTVDTVRWLKKRWPAGRIVLCVGGDMLLSFERWHDWQALLQLVELCGQARDEEEYAALQQKAEELRRLGGRVTLCSPVAVQLSSTQVRLAVAQDRKIDALVPETVAHVIQQRGLYQASLPNAAACKKAVRAKLSAARYRHTLNVCRQAVHLSRLYGVDVRRARIAALLHDFMKETSQSDMLQIFSDNDIIKTGIAQRTPALWHGVCAALVARQRFGLTDEAVLSAIACHTCGKPGMSALDKVLYLADMTSAERDFDGVQTLRDLCEQDLDAAMIWALHHTIDYLVSRGKAVDAQSAAALQDLEAKKGATHESK